MRFFCKRWIFGFLSLICSLFTDGQILQFENLTTRDGLPSEEVFNFFQDKKGYLWIFTNYGVVKYNSRDFKNVLKNIPFHESFIYAACENEKGEMFVANSKAHIYKIRNDSAFLLKGIENYSEELRQTISEILKLNVDKEGVIYVQTKRYSHKLIPDSRGYTAHKLLVPVDSIYFDIVKMGDNYLTIHNFNGNDLVRHGGRKRLFINVIEADSSRIVELRADARIGVRSFKRFGNACYAAIDNYIAKIENTKVTYRKLHSFVLSFTQDKNGHTWVGCFNGGLYELDKNDSIINHYFPNTTINDVFIDSSNGLWVSTSGQGIYHCKNLGNIIFNPGSILGTPISFLKHLEKGLYVANVNGDICVFKNNRIDTLRLHTIPDPATDITFDNHKNILVSLPFGLEIYGQGTRTVNLANVINFLPGNADTIICLLRRDIVLLKDNKPEIRYNLLNKSYSIIGRNREYFIGTENGVYQLQNGKLIQPSFLKPTASYVSRRLCADPHGDIWICTLGNGLFRLKPDNQLLHYEPLQSMPGNIVNDISFNVKGDKSLLSTNKGLFLIDANNPYSNMRLLYHGEVSQASFFEGKIYIATKKGLAILDDSFNRSGIKNYFHLQYVKINSDQFSADKLSDLPHDHHSPDFVFDIISYSQQVAAIEFKLSGPVSDKGTVVGTHLRFQNLKPGMYVLTAFPQAPEGKMASIIIPFNIKPAYWQTGIFWFLLIVFSLSVVVLTSLIIARIYRKRQEKRTESEKLILEYQLIALKAQINPHFVSNCLTAIQHLIVHKQLDAATIYIAKFGLLVRQILNFSTKSLASLPEELNIALLNIEMEQLRFKDKFQYKITYKLLEGRSPESIYVPALVLNPVIENAIWHGLLPSVKQNKRLDIIAEQQDGMLHLIIEDNGIGRIAAKSTPQNNRESKGIAITEQRLANINYLYGVTTSGLKFEDLSDNKGEAAGTRVIISLPADLQPFKK